MYVFRHSFSIIFFCALCLGVFIAAGSLKWERSDQLSNKTKKVQDTSSAESYFTGVNYFVFEGGKSTLHLNADELTINNVSQRVGFLNPEGVVFTGAGEPVHYTALRGVLIQKENTLDLTDEVNLRLNNSTMAANKMLYNFEKNKIQAKGQVKTISKSQTGEDSIKVESDSVLAWPKLEKSTYLGNVKGRVERSKVYEESVDFRSDKMDLNLPKSLIKLDGSVFLKKQQLKANSLRGEIFLENYNKKLKYFVLYDDVKVVEKVMLEGLNSSSFDRKALSEKLEGIMSEGRIILTGYPKVFQQGDVIKGNRITLRENNEVVEVDDANTNIRLKQ